MENLLILSIFISPLCKNWHSSYLWWVAVSASFVWPHYIRVLKLCQAFFETFLNFFSLSLIYFYWFGRSVLFLACLCFVPPVWWRQAHYTQVLHPRQALFWKICEKSFKKFLSHWFGKKKGRTFFSPALLVIMKNQPIMDVKGRVHTIYHRACKMFWVKCACLC